MLLASMVSFHRQTDRHIDRQIDTREKTWKLWHLRNATSFNGKFSEIFLVKIDRQVPIDRQVDIQIETYRRTDRDMYIGRQVDKKALDRRKIDKQTDRLIDRQRNIQIGRHVNRQTDRQIE